MVKLILKIYLVIYTLKFNKIPLFYYIFLSLIFSLIFGVLLSFIAQDSLYIIVQTIVLFVCFLFIPVLLHYENQEKEESYLIDNVSNLMSKNISQTEILKTFGNININVPLDVQFEAKIMQFSSRLCKDIYLTLWNISKLSKVDKNTLQNFIDYIIRYVELKKSIKIETTIQSISLYILAIILPIILSTLSQIGNNVLFDYVLVSNLAISIVGTIFEGKLWRMPYIYLFLNLVSYLTYVFAPYVINF